MQRFARRRTNLGNHVYCRISIVCVDRQQGHHFFTMYGLCDNLLKLSGEFLCEQIRERRQERHGVFLEFLVFPLFLLSITCALSYFVRAQNLVHIPTAPIGQQHGAITQTLVK